MNAAPVPAPPTAFPIVGLGASAGGLAAFQAFFSGLATVADPGMAFVLVQHLAPDHKSVLTELIRRTTRMPVTEIADGMVIQANCVYVIPPNQDLACLNGTLQLLPRPEPHGRPLQIDFFFGSLAQDQRDRAIGIVLSGTGSDGAGGVRAIKSAGGLVLAQSPASAEFDGMPRSALATGLVDFELPPDEMGARLLAFCRHVHHRPPEALATPLAHNESALQKIMVLVRARTGHDFSLYKPSTIHRRIARRMALHQIESVDDYVKFLQQPTAEAGALFYDFLIGVTKFFRDADAFQVLEDRVIPAIVGADPGGAPLRIWVPACSTGEEAYSIAILLTERMEALRLVCPVKIFATDIDGRAIATARQGYYPASIAADLTPDRLARFFTAEAGGYQISKAVRDLLIFSEQDVVRDPPFSRLDLISCRNLLIYMGAELQRKLVPVFHYALKPGGLLFLGTSETASEFGEFFAALDRTAKVYRRKTDHPLQHPTPANTSAPPTTSSPAPLRPADAKPPGPTSLRERTEQALLRLAFPAAALVTAAGDILYLHGRAGMYLEPAPGEAGTQNILKMARTGLRAELTRTLRQAASAGETVRRAGLRVETHGHVTTVTLTIQPVVREPAFAAAAPEFLVMLEEAPLPDPAAVALPPGPHPGIDPDAQALMTELRAKEEHLQSANEELRRTAYEFKCANEEMQSVNEELQSSNEELETAKEEMQSVNEELTTVNTELQTSIEELSKTKNDLLNLLAGTGIATLFVDLHMRILRFTPSAAAIINLIPGDAGRPIQDLGSQLLGYDRLVPDAQEVLDTLIPKKIEVQTREGAWYSMRFQPYRTLENSIEGVVIAFVEITESVRTREALRKAHKQSRLAVVVRDSHDAITVRDLDGRILAWNPAAVRIFGWSEAEALQMNASALVPPECVKQERQQLASLVEAPSLEPFRTQRLTRSGALVDVSMIAQTLRNPAGQPYAIATTERAVPGGAL
jgi:two-component system CheB/CheR fusion protein